MDTSVEQRVLGFLQRVGAMPRPSVTAGDLRSCEHRIGRALPPDVARFYACMNGTEETGEWLFDVWPLEKVGSVPEVVTPFAGIPDYSQISDVLPNASEYFAFADCMIWSHVFAVRVALAAATEVVWLCGTTYAVVAPTFDAFWELYLCDPETVLFASKSGHKSGLQ